MTHTRREFFALVAGGTAAAISLPTAAGATQATPTSQVMNDYLAGRTVYGEMDWTVYGWWRPNLTRFQGANGEYYAFVTMANNKVVAFSERTGLAYQDGGILGEDEDYEPLEALRQVVSGTSQNFLVLLLQLWILFWVMCVIILLGALLKAIFFDSKMKGDMKNNSWGVDLTKPKPALRADMKWLREQYPQFGAAIQAAPGGDVVTHWLDTGSPYWP